MKKLILATTALVSVAGVSSALAQESMVMGPMGADASIGAYYEYRFTDYSGGTGTSSADSEIFISFSRVTANGLEVGVDFQLESNTDSTTNADEASLYIAGDFGRVVFGENDHASDSFQTWAPTHAGSIGQDDATNLGGWAGNASYNDDAKIAYFSPNISGFNFGVSWKEAAGADDDPEFTLGGSYAFDLSDSLDLTVRAASFSNGQSGSDQDESLSYGATLGAGALTFTAANVDYEAETDPDSRFGLGIGYAISDDLSIGAYYAEQGETEWNSFSAEYVIASGLTASIARNGEETETSEADEVVFEIGVSF